MPTCPSCGAPRAEGANFCPACGAPSARASPQPPSTAKTSTLATVGLVLGFVPCIGLVGVVLGIVALVRIQKRPAELKGTALAIGAITVPISLFLVYGILGAVAIPSFIKFQSRAKQSEAKITLRTLASTQSAYVADHGAPAQSFDDLGFTPDSPRRYAYFLGHDVKQPDQGGPYAIPPDLEAAVHAPSVVAAAVGNIDSDATLDVWTVDAQGQLQNLRNDVER